MPANAKRAGGGTRRAEARHRLGGVKVARAQGAPSGASYHAPDAAEAAFAFFAFFFEAFVSDAPAGALAAAVSAGADAAASLVFFDFFVPEASAGALAGIAAGAAVSVEVFALLPDFVVAGVEALAPVGAAVEPLIVKPAASRLTTDLAPSPLTRAARSSASLNGPFLV